MAGYAGLVLYEADQLDDVDVTTLLSAPGGAHLHNELVAVGRGKRPNQ